MPTANAQSAQRKIIGVVSIPLSVANEIQKEVLMISNLAERLTAAQTSDITTLLYVLLVSSMNLDASDIHIEPEKAEVKVRLRIDGILQDVVSLPTDVHKALLSRLKLTAGAKINIKDKPQDGRFSFAIQEKDPAEVRCSFLPSEYGESIVMRVLNPKNLISFEGLGLRRDLFDLFEQALRHPNGMIAATGPTGCGKTTTLYAFIKKINKPQLKLITIEDPIEYHLAGISQTQVEPEKGYTFETGLQALMRQDPDIILVGEIRDKATAKTALQAALTGHLVFSTLHTNDAPGTVTRLRSLGAKSINIAAALNLAIGQRLLRKVCSKCASESTATPGELKKITSGLKDIPADIKPSIPKTLQIARAKGCRACNNTGYKGRTAIFEVIEITDKIEKYILTKPSVAALRSFAEKEGMVPMYQDGLLKVVEKITTLEELERVVLD